MSRNKRNAGGQKIRLAHGYFETRGRIGEIVPLSDKKLRKILLPPTDIREGKTSAITLRGNKERG
jgi:hypothetical protein